MLSADFLYESYNPELIYNYLADLINPMNLVVLVGDKEFKLDENEIVKATSLL